ncbi:hypothetical protein Pmar_PMAR010093 [Perkinsus marinus ATCC 50983]|uniref:RAP domain-containing protein n=1 Tax=Perkinsus marinus (strain ATCC 50983 / TXsc) TaxID=423536 RepID=C5K4T6_PERM5|nr:hypothetical protein Pmar_PMAR010093 [Perkinsus marinus ATCC 50983]EER20358.1 hypothetical protein Pmar_PMAR010093 [Perkinsus marinus ATCC 50983]|eukprot:XP_002788562.1 hypothetical protein Pmar_PMAR010093 [Perkinsus marinus ATCC 50983]
MSGRRTRTIKASASSSVPTRGSSKDKENRDDLRVIATGSLLGDGQRWKKKYLSHSEVSTTTASLPAAADEKSAGYCGGDTRPRRHSSKASSSEGRQDSFVLAKEQVHINRTLTNPKASVSDLINVAKTNRLMFNTVNWATLFHRLARFHAKEAATNYRPEIKTLLHQCRLEEDCSCQHLANLSWAMAKLRIVDMVLLHSVVEKSLAMSELMNPPDVTNLCWSLAKSRSFLDEPSQFHELEEIVNDM